MVVGTASITGLSLSLSSPVLRTDCNSLGTFRWIDSGWGDVLGKHDEFFPLNTDDNCVLNFLSK